MYTICFLFILFKLLCAWHIVVPRNYWKIFIFRCWLLLCSYAIGIFYFSALPSKFSLFLIFLSNSFSFRPNPVGSTGASQASSVQDVCQSGTRQTTLRQGNTWYGNFERFGYLSSFIIKKKNLFFWEKKFKRNWTLGLLIICRKYCFFFLLSVF